MTPPDWHWIDHPRQLEEAGDDLRRAALIAIDTEYDSFRYFREKLCLLQISTAEQTYLLDPLGGFSLQPLGAVFSNPAQIKIFHAGANDIRLLRREYNFQFQNLFDTYLAAQHLDLKGLSLEAIASYYLDRTFGKTKSLQRSRWDRRPLSPEQMDYAAQDTAFLIPLYERLVTDLRKRNLMEQAQRSFEALTLVSWGDKARSLPDPARIRGYRALTETQQGLFRTLHHWRFHRAEQTDRAPMMILSDADLLRIAQGSPARLEDLQALLPARASSLARDLYGLLRRHAPRNGGRRTPSSPAPGLFP